MKVYYTQVAWAHWSPHVCVLVNQLSCMTLIYLSTSSLGHTVATSSGKDSSSLTTAWGTLPEGKPWPRAVRSRERENHSSSLNSPPRHYPLPRIMENTLSMKMLGRNGRVPPIPPPGKWSLIHCLSKPTLGCTQSSVATLPMVPLCLAASAIPSLTPTKLHGPICISTRLHMLAFFQKRRCMIQLWEFLASYHYLSLWISSLASDFIYSCDPGICITENSTLNWPKAQHHLSAIKASLSAPSSFGWEYYPSHPWNARLIETTYRRRCLLCLIVSGYFVSLALCFRASWC